MKKISASEKAIAFSVWCFDNLTVKINSAAVFWYFQLD
jgi:hypothetical protein